MHINQKRGKCALLDENNDERKIKYPFMIKVCTKLRPEDDIFILHYGQILAILLFNSFLMMDLKISLLVPRNEVYATIASTKHCVGIIPGLPEITSVIDHFLLKIICDHLDVRSFSKYLLLLCQAKYFKN